MRRRAARSPGIPALGLAPFLLICAALSAPLPAAGQGAEKAAGDAALGRALLLSPLLLIPSAIGPEIAIGDGGDRDGRLLLGWPVQWPITNDSAMSHRVAAAVETALGAANGARWRARLGYRYGGEHVIAGMGGGVDGAGWFLSPEIGLRIPRRKLHHDFQPYALLALRVDVPPSEPDRPRVSLTIGWILF